MLLCAFIIKDVKDVIVTDIIMPNLEVKEDNVVAGFKIHKKTYDKNDVRISNISCFWIFAYSFFCCLTVYF